MSCRQCAAREVGGGFGQLASASCRRPSIHAIAPTGRGTDTRGAIGEEVKVRYLEGRSSTSADYRQAEEVKDEEDSTRTGPRTRGTIAA